VPQFVNAKFVDASTSIDIYGIYIYVCVSIVKLVDKPIDNLI
jgi:hypothetical protein